MSDLTEAVWRTFADANVSHHDPLVNRGAGYLWNALSLICEERRAHAEAQATLIERAERAEKDTARLDGLINACNHAKCHYLSDSIWDDLPGDTDDPLIGIRAVIDAALAPAQPEAPGGGK